MRFSGISSTLRFALAFVMLQSMPALAMASDFPNMSVNTLAGATLDLPDAFADGPSVIVVVYDQNQQADADTWIPFLDQMATSFPAVRYYIMPVLPAGLSMVRGMVEGVIRSTTTDLAQLDRTILLFTDVSALQEHLDISGTSAIHIVVLDDAGKVAATASGAHSQAAAERIGDALATLQGNEVSDPTGGEQDIDIVEQLH